MKKGTARWVIVGIIGISILAASSLSRLGFDYDFERFFPVNDTDLSFYQSYRAHFESDIDFLLLGIEQRPSVFDTSFLQRIDTLTHRLTELKSVVEVVSPTNVKQPILGPFGGAMEVPYLHPYVPEKYAADSLRIHQSPHLLGTVFAANNQSVSLLIKTEMGLRKSSSDSLLNSIEEAVDAGRFQNIHLSGKLKGTQYYVTKMQQEMVLFFVIIVCLLIVFLSVAFRSFHGVWVPLVVVGLSIVWVLAIMVLLGKKIDLLMMLLPTIVFVVGMSDVVHLMTRYLEELRNGMKKLDAIKLAFKEIGMATFLTSLTTSVGFLTLITSSVVPIKEFGLFMAIGVMVALTLALTFLPAVLSLTPSPAIAEKKDANLLWNRLLHGQLLWLFRNKKALVIGWMVVLLVAGWGMSQLRINNFLLESLSDDDPHKVDMVFFEENYAGVRPFELAVLLKDSSKSFFDSDVLQELQQVETYLQKEYGVGYLYSPISLVKATHQAIYGGAADQYRLPTSAASLRKVRKKINEKRFESVRSGVIVESQGLARVTGKLGDVGSCEMTKRNEAFHAYVNQLGDQSLLTYKLTGTAELIDKNNAYLASSMLWSLGIALVLIAAIMGFLYRSWFIVLAAVITNTIPMVLLAGFMGWMGIEIKVNTSIVFVIAFGIAVDDTIHFLSKMKLELAKKPRLMALKRTYLSTGKAIIVTSLILCTGFWVLLFSDFIGTFHIGLSISFAMLFAVLSDLLLLPLFVLIWRRNELRNKS